MLRKVIMIVLRILLKHFHANMKTWDELSSFQRKAIRMSWKYWLPECYDVFLSDWSNNGSLNIPGNLYVSGNINCNWICVRGNCTVDGNIQCISIKTYGSCDIHGSIVCNYIEYGFVWGNGKPEYANFAVDGNVSCQEIQGIGDLTVGSIDPCKIDIHGNIFQDAGA